MGFVFKRLFLRLFLVLKEIVGMNVFMYLCDWNNMAKRVTTKKAKGHIIV